MKFDMGNCPQKPLTDLLTDIIDNRGKTVPTSDKGHKLIATNCIRNENLYPTYEKIRYLSDETYKTWFRAHPIPGDIIFVNKGTPGRVCMVPDPIDFCIAQDMIAFRSDEKKIYNKYLFSVLRSETIQSQIYNFNVGDVIPHFKKSFLEKIMIPLPDMQIQRAIGDFYYNLSYKIELNNRINKNLEAQAQAIFKSWFVDFEPFRDGEFVDSELGLIPKGWKVDSLDSIASFTNGLAMQKFRPETGDSGLHVLKIKELRQGIIDETSELCSSAIDKDYIVKDGDVIFSWSGSLMVDIWCGGTCGLNQHLFKVTSSCYDKWFYYLWICRHLAEFQAIAQDKATTMGHIKRSHLAKAKILIPSEAEYHRINSAISPLVDLIIKNRLQNERLAALRDTLLPKLMSGEIRVPLEV